MSNNLRSKNPEDRKTAGVVTFHKSLSYGGCLQAWATKTLLENLGYEVRFIDYENNYEARKKSKAIFRYGTVKEVIAATVKRALFQESAFQERAFGGFRQALPLTKRSYNNVGEMGDIVFDLLAVASDQVWNPQITGVLDPVFFLQFGRACKRVSIASSMGSHLLNETELAQVASYLDDFDAISVREEFARSQLDQAVCTDIHVSLDPTLQLPAEWWRRLATRPNLPFEEYILVFMVASSPSKFEWLAKEARRELGKPIVMIRLNSKCPSFVDSVLPASPFELVWLIDNADLVLTDSFHGLAFCANMNTVFSALPNTRNNVRLNELLMSLGLEDRMIAENNRCIDFGLAIDFSSANAVLDHRRAADSIWLRAAVEWGKDA